MHATRNNRGTKTFAATLLAVAIGLASTGYAQAQSVQFSSEADSDSGTATQTLLGLLQSPQNWGPDDQSQTTTSGSNDQTAPSIDEDISGVDVFESEDADNSTDAGATGDQADASSSSGSGSALGGLISWSNLSIQLSCLPDGSISDQIDCTTYESVTNLLINGQPAAKAGSFAAGTSIPVSGNIPDTNCPLGTDSFTGNVVLDNSILNSGGEQGSDNEIGMQITGTATCDTLGLVPLYTTAYNEQIGAPRISYEYTAQKYIVEKQVNYYYY
ncbi:hypothetical protein [Dyella caseinilytica]|uniref:Uncharacterized protein n=1 Tax=Dyella caseinilytica TaxID=1849581 RepID=A0ABX7GQ13_9GAMM|nr:hypothetical protein [Dyella caseinilytica]QRN52153.1 hypothetical protein ISN74_11645 [Dyella caseinilytica]GGA13747.1 hypothetical protein GCM10011408_39060 [Dyella caseinilytica]